jgi:hypothetical protein
MPIWTPRFAVDDLYTACERSPVDRADAATHFNDSAYRYPRTSSPLAWMFVPAPMMCPLGVALAVPSTDQDAGRVSARWSRKSGNCVLACSSIAAANSVEK